MKKKHFALIGYNLSHTISHIIHQHYFQTFNIDADYEILNIKPDDFEKYVPYIKSLDGYNVTIPYKQKIISYLDGLSPKASLCGSVNTVKNVDNSSVGYTTDEYGFISSLELAGIPLKGNVVILGYGGVARVIAYQAAALKCKITIAARDKSIYKASILCDEIRKQYENVDINVCSINKIENQKINLLVNATPVGMYPKIDASPVESSVLKKCLYVFDTIYNPMETKLMKEASFFGCKTSNGLDMLILQAIESEHIWNN